MENRLAKIGSKKSQLIRATDTKDVRYRLNLFEEWLMDNGYSIMEAELSEFRDDLLERNYAAKTVRAALSTVRERIHESLRNNKFLTSIKHEIWQRDQKLSPGELELQLQSILRQIENNINSKSSQVKITKIQDRADEERLWLNGGLDAELLEQVGEDKPELMALRDRAIVALFLATGVRREELCNLTADDLFKHYQEEPALLVREGKGNKQRMIVYGALMERYIKPYVNPWVDTIVKISPNFDLPLFQGFYKGAKKLTGKPLNPATVNKMLMQQIFDIDGREIYIKPHDLRRTYARMLFQEYKMSVTGIQQQMGHAKQDTTLDYIGVIDVDFRTP